MLSERGNWVRQAMREGKKVSGAWLSAASNITAEIIAEVGFDVAVIDMEHSPSDILCLIGQIQAMKGCRTVPFVRAPWNDPVIVKRILDAGAFGLFFPFVNTREEAELAVAAALYPENGMGIRGMAGGQRASRFSLDKGYLKRVNNEISIFVQTESPTGLRNLDAILAVERVDGIVIGPMDLATNMGFFANPQAPEVQKAIAEIEAKTLAAGKALVTVGSGWEDTEAKYRRGYSLVLSFSDVSAISQAGKKLVDTFNETFAQ